MKLLSSRTRATIATSRSRRPAQSSFGRDSLAQVPIKNPAGVISRLRIHDLAFAKILQIFTPRDVYDKTVSPAAFIDSTASIGAGVTIFPGAFIGANAKVGDGSVLYPGVFIGAGAQIGADCVLHANVVVRERCRIGARVLIHAGAVIGADGFGFAGAGAARVKIPQAGSVDVGTMWKSAPILRSTAQLSEKP